MPVTPVERGGIAMTVRIAARREAVFGFFMEPEKMLRWKGVQAILDPRPGGTYRVDINGRDVVSGTYVSVEPYSRVVFTWGWEGEGSPLPPGSSTVEVTLEEEGGDTIVHLRHTGLPPDQVASHDEGWRHFLPRLEVAASGGDPGPDPWAQPGNGN
jgi:uncharacterized protein YndB with AHSA1/START domain